MTIASTNTFVELSTAVEARPAVALAARLASVIVRLCVGVPNLALMSPAIHHLNIGDNVSMRHSQEWLAAVRAARTTHGLKHTTEYRIWDNLKTRCLNQNNVAYPRYGGRGIHVCDAWRYSFRTFLDDMGHRPSTAHTLERRDNDGHYEPGNCVWATRSEQARNRRSSRFLEFRGERLTVAAWADRVGLVQAVLLDRLKDGWSIERTLTTPLMMCRSHRHAPRPSPSGSNP